MTRIDEAAAGGWVEEQPPAEASAAPAEAEAEGEYGSHFDPGAPRAEAPPPDPYATLLASSLGAGVDIYLSDGPPASFLSGDEEAQQPSDEIRACPPTYAEAAADTVNWRSYNEAFPAGAVLFHCDYEGVLENRPPTPESPMNECFYDENGRLVDEDHAHAAAGGTPDQYDGGDGVIGAAMHFAFDSGGIVQSGPAAFIESRICDMERVAREHPEWDTARDVAGGIPFPAPPVWALAEVHNPDAVPEDIRPLLDEIQAANPYLPIVTDGSWIAVGSRVFHTDFTLEGEVALAPGFRENAGEILEEARQDFAILQGLIAEHGPTVLRPDSEAHAHTELSDWSAFMFGGNSYLRVAES